MNANHESLQLLITALKDISERASSLECKAQLARKTENMYIKRIDEATKSIPKLEVPSTFAGIDPLKVKVSSGGGVCISKGDHILHIQINDIKPLADYLNSVLAALKTVSWSPID